MSPLGIARKFVKALVAQDSPDQLAMGLALGVMVGFIPKGTLFAQLGLMAICLFRVNLAAGVAAAALVSPFAHLADPAFHLLGNILLTQTPPLVPLWTKLYNTPLGAWSGFNNTVALGATLLGLLAFYPLYYFLVPWCETYKDTLGKRLSQLKVVKLLLGAELTDRMRPGQ